MTAAVVAQALVVRVGAQAGAGALGGALAAGPPDNAAYFRAAYALAAVIYAGYALLLVRRRARTRRALDRIEGVAQPG